MYCIAEGRVLPPLTDEERQELLKQAHLCSLVEMLEAVPDPRGKHGLRYDLPFLLTCLIAALLCNCNSSEAVSQWCQEHLALLREVFGNRQFFTPSGSLYRWLLPQLNASSLEWVLSAWIRASSQAQPTDPIAFDGKTVRGARTAEQKAPHLLSFYTHESQEVWLEATVDEKTNEIPVAQALLPFLPLAGRPCTADALHTHAPLWKILLSHKAYPLFVVKQNTPVLYENLETYFSDPHAQYIQAETLDRHRGRREHRQIRVSYELNDYLANEWPRLAQIAEIVRTRTEKGETNSETVYLITALTALQAPPHRLLQLARGHWGIENSLHYVRDVTFGEDASRIATGNAPHCLAALRNLVLTLLHRMGSSGIPTTRRSFSYHPDAAFRLLFHKPATGSQ